MAKNIFSKSWRIIIDDSLYLFIRFSLFKGLVDQVVQPEDWQADSQAKIRRLNLAEEPEVEMIEIK